MAERPTKKPNKANKEARNKVGEYNLISKFAGYRAREDQTLLPPNIMVSPSQNVVQDTSGTIGPVLGYTLDGPASTAIDSGILSNFDFTTFDGNIRNLRVGFLTTAGNDGKIQYRYVNGAGTVSWIDLKGSLTNVVLSFCEYWDSTALVRLCLWVDGSDNIFAWNGSVTTFASATVNTVTKQGTSTWAEAGFSATGSIVIGGVSATYSGGAGTTTLTGVSVDFSATSVGAVVHQAVVTRTLASMTAILATFSPTVIGCGRQNQVYLGAANSNNLYISKVNDYTNYTFTTPVRLVGEGDLIPLDAPPVKFIAQENKEGELSYDMWISEGTSQWSIIRSTLSSDLTSETLQHIRLKTAPLQGAMSERLAAKMKNHIIFAAADNTINALGYISYQYVPVMQDISYPIIDDQNSYDLSNGSIFYHKNYIYEAVPEHGLIRIYNMTDQTQEQFSNYNPIEQIDAQQPWFWEAPIGYPISGFYVTETGDLYGHSFTTSESYKLFTGGSFNGQDITAQAVFAFDDKEDRTQNKGSNEVWIEGYIQQNTDLMCTIAGDLDTFQTSQTVTVEGDDSSYVAYGSGANAIGKNHLGAAPLGGSTPSNSLPAWFHVAKTYVQVPSYLEQISFYSKGVDLMWKLLCFGTNAKPTVEGNNSITD